MSGRWLRRIATATAVVLALVAGVGVYQWQARAAAPDPAAEIFYGQRLRDGTNQERAMGDLRGKVVVINFWATWCAPCVEEIPMFSRLHAEHVAKGGQVAFVGLGIDSPGNVVGFNERFKPSYPLLMAGASGTELARAFGDAQGGLPFTVLLGKDGKVIATKLGKVDEPTLAEWLAAPSAAR